MSTESRSRKIDSAFVAAALFLGLVVYWVSDAEFGPLIKVPERELQFAHPLSTQLDRMMRSDSEILVIGDPTFVAKVKSSEAALGGTVQYLELPQVDLYAIVAILPAVLRSQATVVVMESIPAYWSGDVYMAVQPPAGAVEAAILQVNETVPTAIDPPPPAGRDYIISPPRKPFDITQVVSLVFDNYSGYWRDVDDCSLWITNDDLLQAASPEFQSAYHAEFPDPAELHPNIGHVGSLEYAPQLLAECRKARAEQEHG